MQTIFVTGIGTDVGKTLVSAILAEALHADYWKPVQAGYDTGTDALSVKALLSNKKSNVHDEVYKFSLPASPHISAREEDAIISLDKIRNHHSSIQASLNNFLIVEGAGGINVPLNEHEFVFDLIKKLQAKVILVSRNYLGSINHSLLTAAFCKQTGIDVIGWIFNDHYMQYEDEIVKWSGYKKIASLPFVHRIDKDFIYEQAQKIQPVLQSIL
jgi:dethiobiotin synthetase